jgi:hypothetical protein
MKVLETCQIKQHYQKQVKLKKQFIIELENKTVNYRVC